MRMKIYVIRHGLTELNKKKIVNGRIDEPLAAEGVEQAKAALSLVPASIQYIYTSPLLRAQQTTFIINSNLQKPVSVHPELAEIDIGSLAGKSWTEMEAGLDLKQKHRSMQFDYRQVGGESIQDVKKRLFQFLNEIKDKHGDHQVLLVTHGGIIRLLHMLEHGEQLEEIEHISFMEFDLKKILDRN